MTDRKASSSVVFNSINVNAIDSQSGIFIGENKQWNWSSISKSNSGFGTVDGQNNVLLDMENIVVDPDLVDNPASLTQGQQSSKCSGNTDTIKQDNTSGPS